MLVPVPKFCSGREPSRLLESCLDLVEYCKHDVNSSRFYSFFPSNTPQNTPPGATSRTWISISFPYNVNMWFPRRWIKFIAVEMAETNLEPGTKKMAWTDFWTSNRFTKTLSQLINLALYSYALKGDTSSKKTFISWDKNPFESC